eukprot:327922-Chlamydomonas_euryale.AAC.1
MHPHLRATQVVGDCKRCAQDQQGARRHGGARGRCAVGHERACHAGADAAQGRAARCCARCVAAPPRRAQHVARRVGRHCV